MSALYVLEFATLFCGDDDPANAKHLTIDKLDASIAADEYGRPSSWRLDVRN